MAVSEIVTAGEKEQIDTAQKITLVTQLLRLLIGLSSSAIILVATFLRDLFFQPVDWKPLLIAVFAFAFCVLFSMLYFIGLTRGAVIGKPTIPGKYLGSTWVFVGSELSFFVGLVCLAYFIIANLLVLGGSSTHH